MAVAIASHSPLLCSVVAGPASAKDCAAYDFLMALGNHFIETILREKFYIGNKCFVNIQIFKTLPLLLSFF